MIYDVLVVHYIFQFIAETLNDKWRDDNYFEPPVNFGFSKYICKHHVIMLCRRNIATWPEYMGIGRDA